MCREMVPKTTGCLRQQFCSVPIVTTKLEPQLFLTLDGTAEDGIAEVGLTEVGTAEVGTAEVGIAEDGTAEVGIAEVGIAEVGTAEVGIAEVGTREVGLGEVRDCLICPAPLIPFADFLFSTLEKLESLVAVHVFVP